MIHFDHVSKRYETGYEALSHLRFDVKAGEMLFLTGHSGAGKSTLMKLIMLMERPTQGQIIVDGHNLRQMANSQIPYYRRNIGVVFQNHQLLFDRSVFDNVALPLHIAGLSHHEIGRRVRAALDKVSLLEKERLNPFVLSGGEQQRVGIARAVVNKPALLLADEPTGNLDPELSEEIMTLFRQFNEVGVTIMIASHDINLLKRMNKRILGLAEGKLIHDGIAWPELKQQETKKQHEANTQPQTESQMAAQRVTVMQDNALPDAYIQDDPDWESTLEDSEAKP